MQTVQTLFDLAGGRVLPAEEDGPARRVQLMVSALLASVALAALYGIAAGSAEAGLAVANLYKVPMVIVLSALCAVPAALVTWKLVAAGYRATDLLVGLAAGNFSGTLVLAVLAPVVALYYHTSTFLGGFLAMAASMLALVVGLVVLLRTVFRRVEPGHRGLKLLVPLVVMAAMQLATMAQLIHVASPILPEITVFDGGMDALVGR
jgi:hypothetical protein